MKRINRRLLAVVASSALALPMAAQVQADEMEVPEHSHPVMHEHEHDIDGAMAPMHAHQTEEHSHAEFSQLHGHSASVYGSLRYGVTLTDNDTPGSNSVSNLGASNGARFGVRGSVEAGGGVTAGFRLEKEMGTSVSARYHNVYLSGPFGTTTFGQQDAPYHGGTSWDGSNALGGLTNGASRISGVSYASNLGGPFSFSALLGSGAAGADAAGDGVNHTSASASLATGAVTLSVGYRDDDDTATTVGSTRIGGTAGGSLAAINWEIGANSGQDSCGNNCDDDAYGFHAGYTMGDGNAFVQFSERDSDDNMMDTDGWVFGYSHTLAPGVLVYAEHRTVDSMSETDGEVTTTTSVAYLSVDF